MELSKALAIKLDKAGPRHKPSVIPEAHPLESLRSALFMEALFSWRILEVKWQRQGKVESVPTRLPMINDAPNIPLRFSKQLCMAALECGISCPLGAPAPPQSSGAPVCLHQGCFSHFPSVLPKSHQRGRGRHCTLFHHPVQTQKEYAPNPASNSSPPCEEHGLAMSEYLLPPSLHR